MLKLALAGASGRMGMQVQEAVTNRQDVALTQALVSKHSNFIGQQVGQTQLRYTTALAPGAQVLVVFALPQASLACLDEAVAGATPVVMCTTGFGDAELARLRVASNTIPLLYAPNTSLGVVWLARLGAQLAKSLPQADIEIVEAHHRHKLDAPSGTSLRLGRAVAEARGDSLDNLAEYSRNNAGQRKPGSIGFASLRLGGVVGEHRICFGLEGETIELTHRAISRQTFAQGALDLAVWLASQPPGYYLAEDAAG